MLRAPLASSGRPAMAGAPRRSRPAVPILAALVLAALLALPSAAARAQTEAHAPAERAAGPAADPAVDPAAREALRAMGRALEALTSFEVTAETTIEAVLDTDQKLLIGGTATYQARRPDHLKVTLATDVVERAFFYDGASAAYVAPREGFYALVEHPAPTIRGMLDEAAARYGLAFPLADLFAWGAPDVPEPPIEAAFRVGPAVVEGHQTEHWAFRGPARDWELWIRAEGAPLPLRLSTVDRSDPTRPRFTATLAWTEAKDFPDALFTYAPPPRASRIDFTREDGK